MLWPLKRLRHMLGKVKLQRTFELLADSGHSCCSRRWSLWCYGSQLLSAVPCPGTFQLNSTTGYLPVERNDTRTSVQTSISMDSECWFSLIRNMNCCFNRRAAKMTYKHGAGCSKLDRLRSVLYCFVRELYNEQLSLVQRSAVTKLHWLLNV